jgi:hypothetical protein
MSFPTRPFYGLVLANYGRLGYQAVYGQEKLSKNGGSLRWHCKNGAVHKKSLT